MPPIRFYNPAALTLTVFAGVMLIGLLAADLVSSRQKAFTDASRQIEQHDRILAEHVARSLDSIEVLLDEMRVAIQGEGGDWQRWSTATGHEHLKARLTRSLPQIRHLIIFDAEGFQRHTSFAEAPPRINIRDRPYFVQLRNGAERSRFGPYVGRNSQRMTYAIARRLTTADGKFSGALMIAIEPDYFEDFCRSTRPYSEFEAAIANAEGTIISLCRSLAPEAEQPTGGVGDDFRRVLARGEFADTALITSRSLVASKNHLMATIPVPGYPDLRVVSGTPREVLTRDWYKHARQVSLMALLVLITLISAGILVRRQIRRMALLTTELKESQEMLEQRIRDATQELNTRRNDAERLAEAKSRFFAAASHDLRQPLHALQLFLGDLARITETPEQQVLVQRIESATKAMTGQLRSMLDISRLDMANIVPERSTLELTSIFEQLATTYLPAAESAHVRLLFRPRTVTLETDPALLSRLIGNLIDNAIKFSPEGTVLVCARWRANAVRIEVRDNGKGIPQTHQQAIYDEFFQVGNDARNPGAGLGLGLAIAHRIARLLGASISLRSEEDKGTSFALTLPCVVGPRPSRNNVKAPSVRLVLIGDPGNFCERAKRWGYNVDVAENVAGAWRMLEAGHAIPVIIHSGSCMLPGEVQALLRQYRGVVITAAGCDMPELGAYHLQEPIKPARLRALLRSLH
jgi:signal transduction histidine kinase